MITLDSEKSQDEFQMSFSIATHAYKHIRGKCDLARSHVEVFLVFSLIWTRRSELLQRWFLRRLLFRIPLLGDALKSGSKGAFFFIAELAGLGDAREKRDRSS